MRIVATVDVLGASAVARNVGIITKGMKGVAVHIQYGDGWEGLVRNVVFSGAEERTIVDAGPVVAIPPEVLANENINLRIGVCGVGDDGETVIPTVWADLGNVRTSAAGVFPLPDAITPDVSAQILSMIGSLPDLETQDKGSLVAAINEVLRNGDGGTSIEIDNSLTKEGQAADAKAVGDKFTEIEEGLAGIVGDIAVQPDWNQNDPEQPDYVKNRTHWIEPRIVLLFESAIEMEPRPTITEGALVNVAENPIPLELTEGKTYTVVWNGRVYSCVCQKRDYYTGAGYGYSWYLGNLDFVGNAGDIVNNGAEMPFLIRRDESYAYASKQWTTTSTVFTNGNEATVANVMIGGEGAAYHPLDEGFIPDTIARMTDIPEGLPEATAEDEGKVLGVVDGEWKPMDAPSGAGPAAVQPDWNQNDPDAPDYVKNRTHWEENTRAVIEWDGNTEGLPVVPLGDGFELHKISDLTPSEEDFYGTVQTGPDGKGAEISESGEGMTQLADGFLQAGFLYVVTASEVTFNGVTLNFPSHGIYTLNYNGETQFSYTEIGSSVIHTLDEKFIPNSIARVKDIPSDTVLYTPQNLSEAQQKQARENIGAVSAAEVTEIVNEALGVIENGTY